MNLKISNLAQIKEAVIEDSDLVVIVGDNGTGKTLLLESLTLFKEHYRDNLDKLIDTYLDNNFLNIDIETNWDDLIKYYRNTKLENIEDDNKDKSPIKKFLVKIEVENSINVEDFFSNKFELMTYEINDLIKERVLFTEESNVKVELLDIPEVKELYEYEFRFILADDVGILLGGEDEKNLATNVFLIQSEEDLNENNKTLESVETYLPKIVNQETFKKILTRNLKRNFLKYVYGLNSTNGRLLFLPSERNLYMDNALRKTLDQNYNKSKLRYSEYLFNKEYLEFQDSSKRFSHSLISEELRKLFGGTLNFKDNGDVDGLTTTDGNVIKRELFSTKQNRLLPYILIGNPFHNYQEIIIEEPEAHMSLKSMNELLDFIKVLIQRRRKKIYLTTHSDVFFSRLNNFLLTSNDFTTKVYELKKSGSETFLESKTKTEYGYEIDLFSNELEDLYNETITIQNENLDK
ncbi:AAA family ATPase [Metabacillus niabensis]|uniref:ATPase n=2 Tax=Metabacillus niabensis TaxID=324854 RepID=A0ABT9Z840_9BACI|nr:AAA family ATPase [Metabacillus niabensis]MDQ0228428.1 putative ATPase [Metabacillus niabensis]